MLWLKALHLIFMVTWFAGLFYLPRLFVYHAMSDDQISHERFKIMERKLFFWNYDTRHDFNLYFRTLDASRLCLGIVFCFRVATCQIKFITVITDLSCLLRKMVIRF